jgi:hypothetical protein
VIDVTTGNVLKEKLVTATTAISAKRSPDLDPINALQGAEKVTTLLDLVKVNLNEGLDKRDLGSP